MNFFVGDFVPGVQVELILPSSRDAGQLSISVRVGGRLQELRGYAMHSEQLESGSENRWGGMLGIIGVGGLFSPGGTLALPAPALVGVGANAASAAEALHWRWGQIEWVGDSANTDAAASSSYQRVALNTAEGQLLLGGQLTAARVELTATGLGSIDASSSALVVQTLHARTMAGVWLRHRFLF
eukprot:SAG31_NODE_159_length_21911_cov_12.220750_5_plen_184_part_00